MQTEILGDSQKWPKWLKGLLSLIVIVSVCVLLGFYWSYGWGGFKKHLDAVFGGLEIVMLFGTALVIVWYTDETQKIRVISQKQYELAQQQFLLAQKERDEALAQRRNSLSPILTFRTWSWMNGVATMFIKNIGSLVTDIKVNAWEHKVTVAPPNVVTVLPTNGEIRIQIHQVDKDTIPIPFSIQYKDQEGNVGEKRYIWSSGQAPVMEGSDLYEAFLAPSQCLADFSSKSKQVNQS